MKIAVIGQGFVGGSLTTVFSECGFNVYAYDKAGKYVKGALPPRNNIHSFPSSITELVSGNEFNLDINEKHVYFVCVPTPMYEDGTADVSIVESVLDELSKVPGERIAVIKSTVPPGSVEKWNKKYVNTPLRVIFNPEFLTEANALDDMRNQNRIILGGEEPWISDVEKIFHIAFPEIPIIKTTSTTAEMIKYMTNCFLAVKVSFANEISQICESLDMKGLKVKYNDVVEYSKFDKRLGISHWSVPGPVPTHEGLFVRGFGGHCLPKDINALKSVAIENGINPTILQAAWDKNLEVRDPKDRDWEKQIGRAVSKK